MTAGPALSTEPCRRCGEDIDWRVNSKGVWSRWCRRCEAARNGCPAELQRQREIPSGLFVRLHPEPDPVEAAESAERHDRLLRVIRDELTFRERTVLTLRWALDGQARLTLEECARVLHVTRERVRQIEALAIRKLQHPRRARRIDPSMVPHEVEAGHAMWSHV